MPGFSWRSGTRLSRAASQAALGVVPPRGSGGRVALAALLLLLAFVGLQLYQPHPPEYVLVVDAGSSGTRLFAYRWHPAGQSSGGLPRLEAIPPGAAPSKVPLREMAAHRAYQRVETEPGLDQFVSDMEGLHNTALGPLLEWAEAVVPHSRQKHTPVFLFGTAGMRRLPEAQQAQLMAGVRAILGASNFRFEDSWAHAISGVDEGVYGWIALNYLSGTLAGSGGSSNTPSGTLGALDLGGSSLEVTFAADSMPAAEDRVNITVLGAQYLLYTHVHQHYGLNDAFDRSVTLLRAQQATQAGSSGQADGGTGVGPLAGGAQAAAAGVQPTGSIGRQPQADSTSRTSSTAVAAGDPVHQAGQAAAAAAAADGTQSQAGPTVQPVDGSGEQRRTLLRVPAALLRRLHSSNTSSSSRQSGLQPVTTGGVAAAGAALAGELQRDLLAEELQLQVLPKAGGLQRHRRRLAAAEVPTVLHPCLHKGYKQPYLRLMSAEVAPNPPEVLLEGRPDYAACVALAEAVVNTSAPCDGPPCALGAPRPGIGGQRFAALTGFYVVFHFLGLEPSAGLAALQQAGQAHCAKSWAAVQLEREGELHVDRYCFRAPFVEALLKQGLGLSEAQLHIGSPDVGWTLGAALAEGYRLGGLGRHGSSAPVRMAAAAGTRGLTWWVLVLGVGLLAAAALLASCHGSRRGAALASPALRRLFSKRSSEPEELLPITSPPPKPSDSGPGGMLGPSPPSSGSPSSGSWRRSSVGGSSSPLHSLGAKLFGSPPGGVPRQRSQSWATFADGVHRVESYSSLHRLSSVAAGLSNRRMVSFAGEGVAEAVEAVI